METQKNLISKIPKEVLHVIDTLQKVGFEAYLVGGCVRDLLIGKEPKDWDVTTNAKPEAIIKLFKKTVYENTFGTVGVCVPSFNHTQDVPRETKGIDVIRETPEYTIIEVTPYRLESKYTDFRHP